MSRWQLLVKTSLLKLFLVVCTMLWFLSYSCLKHSYLPIYSVKFQRSPHVAKRQWFTTNAEAAIFLSRSVSFCWHSVDGLSYFSSEATSPQRLAWWALTTSAVVRAYQTRRPPEGGPPAGTDLPRMASPCPPAPSGGL